MEIIDRVDDWDPDTVWTRIQKELSKIGERKYFNRISRIMESMGMESLVIGKARCGDVLERFVEISRKFDEMKWEGRKYFPCLRYVALRLLKDYGTEFSVRVPLVKTAYKVKVLDDVYKRLMQS